MPRTPVDPQTAERLLQGRLAADDLPPGLDGVAAVLEAARRSTADSDFSRIDSTVAAMSAALGAGRGTEPSKVRTRSLRGKLAVGSVAGLFSLFGGLAAAGALPSAAQDGLATAVSHVGIDLPRHGNGHGNHKGNTSPAADKGKGKGHDKAGEDTAGTDNAGSSQQPDNHGACVSSVAQDHTTGSQVAETAQSDCGKPPQSEGPAAGATDKPETPEHDTPQSEDHGKPATVPSTVPANAHGNQSGTHGGGH